MKNILYIGFRGRNNSSEIFVRSLSAPYSLLTNSYEGLKRDIGKLGEDYDEVYLFGADKSLSDSFRIERYAEKDGRQLASVLDLDETKQRLSVSGIRSTISENATQYLCNEAYWHLLEKYRGRAVLIHIPTIKHIYDMLPLVL
jgi:hypothetical protein